MNLESLWGKAASDEAKRSFRLVHIITVHVIHELNETHVIHALGVNLHTFVGAGTPIMLK